MPNLQDPRRSGANAILAALPETERRRLSAELEPVRFEYQDTLQEIGRPLEYVWFPHSGVMSTVSEMEDGSVVEVATVGREGIVGIPVVLGAEEAAQRVFCQVPGEGVRLSVPAFRRLLDDLPGLNRLLLRYAQGLVTQIAQGSACNRLHPIEERCARWLLMTHDRVDSNSFPLTQDFIAQMLGVTRPSVSIAAGMLQKAGLISYVRGIITIEDRPGLEAASCECYRVITDEFRRLIGRKG